MERAAPEEGGNLFKTVLALPSVLLCPTAVLGVLTVGSFGAHELYGQEGLTCALQISPP